MGSIERFQESLELLRRGMDLMKETAPQLVQQQAEAEVSLASLLSFMGETKQRLAALEERERVREARLAVVETNISKALSSLFPRVDSLLSQLERKEQHREKINSVPSKEVLQENFPVASTSRETRENNQTASDSPVGGVKKKQNRTKVNNTFASSGSPAVASAPPPLGSPAVATAPPPLGSPAVASAPPPSASSNDCDRQLVKAANGGHLGEICQLIEAGANVNAKSQSGKTVVSITAINGHIDCLHELIRAGADLHETNKEGFNAFHLTAIYGKEATLRILLASGIDVDIKSQDGMTALALASKFGHRECVLALLQESANINVKDCDERTPLHHAVINNSVECISVLLEWKADLHSVDKNALSPLQYALDSDNVEMQNIILGNVSHLFSN